MGSETGTKWLFVLIIYFALMSIIVTLVSDISPITTTGGFVPAPTGVSCGLPRTTYEIDLSATEKQLIITSSDVTEGDLTRSGKVWKSSIECEYSTGQLGQNYCEAIDGCSWVETNWVWFWQPDEFSCEGEFDYTWINESDVDYFYPMHTIDYVNNTQGICAYSDVLTNSTLCSQMGCTWGEQSSIDIFGIDDIHLGKSMLGKLWSVIKQLFTFSFDFGFSDSSANFILNLFIFYLPMIGIALSIVVIVRG